jgi:hypothetical protein
MPRSNIITTDLEKVLKNAIRAELTSGDKDVSKLLGTIIREKLEELEGYFLTSVLKPQNPFDGGVGTPFLCEAPDGGPIYFLFTGWSLGGNREVYIAEIDENLTLKNIRKIIPAGTPSGGIHSAVHALWDPFNENWLLSTTSWTGTGWGIAFHRFDREFTNRLTSYWEGSGVVTDDSGFSMIRGSGGAEKTLHGYFSRSGYGIRHATCPDLTVDPISLTVDSESVTQVVSGFLGSPDALQAVYISPSQMLILAEAYANGMDVWQVFPIFLGDPYYGGYSAIEPLLPIIGDSYRTLHVGHPHLTWLPDRRYPNFFFAMFFDCYPSFKHEIWMCRLPRERLKWETYGELYFTPWFDRSITGNVTSKNVLACGRITKQQFYFYANQGGTYHFRWSIGQYWEPAHALEGTYTANTHQTYENPSIGRMAQIAFEPTTTPASIRGVIRVLT